MQKRILFIVIALCAATMARAEFVFNSNCRQAYDLIISLRFEEGKKLIEAEKLANPRNGIPYLLDNYIDYFGTFVSERSDLFERWKDNMDGRLEQIKKNDKNSPFYLFCQAQIYMQCAFVRFKFKEYLTGSYEIRKAYKLLEKNNALYPSFRANLMGLGVIHALIGTVPEDYKWVASAVGLEGTIQQGIGELNQLFATCKGTSYEFLYPEAGVLLSLLNMYIQKDLEAAVKVMSEVGQSGKSYNPIVCFVESTALLQAGKNEEALKLLQTRSSSPAYFPIPYLDYLEGMARLNKQDPEANVYFLRYVNGFKGNSFVKAAYQKLGWYCLIRSDMGKYAEYMRLCRQKGQANIDEDKQAENEAVTGELPNTILLKSRLLFDGGYYPQALAGIAGKGADRFPRMRDKIELTYRLARIYHKMGELDKAIEYYLTTLNNGSALKYHFAANSALELGYIYEQHKKDPKMARFYFKKCLSLRGHEYQNGIDQKAKAGLNRLGS